MPSLPIPYLHGILYLSILFILIINSQQTLAHTTVSSIPLTSPTDHQSRIDDENNHSVKNSCPLVLPETKEEARSSKPSSSLRIIGGSTPHPSMRSHLISFSQKDDHVCTGSLISSRWALTAGHCFIQPWMTARLGGIKSTSGVTLTIEEVIPHPRYDDKTLDFDISLVRLANNAPPNATFVKINSNSFVPVAGAYARNTGYGENEDDAGPLLQVDVPVIDTDLCRLAYGLGDIADVKLISHSRHICAGHLSGGCGACFGDSGGPLAVFNSQGDIVQIGITSFGNSVQCATQLGPTVYTKVSRFVDWMKSIDGMEFVEETQIVTVFGEDSENAKYVGFSIGSLTPIQSILLIGGIILTLVLIIGLGIYCIYEQRRRRKREQQNKKAEGVMEEGDPGRDKSESENNTIQEPNRSFSAADISGQMMVAKAQEKDDDSLELPSLDVENNTAQPGHCEQTMNLDDLRPLNLTQHDDSLNELARRPTAPPVEQVYIPSFYGGDSTSTG